MPTHNRADVIGYAIRSVLAQTESDFELLIVGDGCTDGTERVVASCGDARIRWFDFPKGPGYGYANRNRAMREARGEFIAFAAHDDLLLHDHLQLLGDTLERDSADWCYSRPLWVSPEGIVYPLSFDIGVESHRSYFLQQNNAIPASCVVHRRGCYERHGFWPEDVKDSADWEFWKRIIGGGAVFAYQPAATVLHFKAIWRDAQRWSPRFLDFARAVSIQTAWPDSLTIEVPPRMTEQEAFWRAISADAPAWTARLRNAVQAAADRVAWHAGAVLAQRHIPVLLKSARLHHKAGETDEALALCGEILELAPDNHAALFQSCTYLLALNRSQEALRTMREAVAANPASAALRHGLSLALERNGFLLEAAAEIAKAAEFAPSDPQIWLRCAKLMLNAGRLAEAKFALDACERLHTDPKWIADMRQAIRQHEQNAAT